MFNSSEVDIEAFSPRKRRPTEKTIPKGPTNIRNSNLLGKGTGSQSSPVRWSAVCELPCCLRLVCCTVGEVTNVVLSTKPGTRLSTAAPSCFTETEPPEWVELEVWVIRLKVRSDRDNVCLPPPLLVLPAVPQPVLATELVDETDRRTEHSMGHIIL